MIISVHIAKTAGKSFQADLKKIFGDGLLSHYGKNANSPHFFDLISQNTQIIHGHIPFEKISTFDEKCPQADYITILRDPVKRKISEWFHILNLADRPFKDNSNRYSEIKQQLKERNFSLRDYIEIPENTNIYASLFQHKKFKEFSLVGLTEYYKEYLDMFTSIYHLNSDFEPSYINVNPNKDNNRQQIDSDTIKRIEEINCEDVEIYNQAKERFLKQYHYFSKNKTSFAVDQFPDYLKSLQKITHPSSLKQPWQLFNQNMAILKDNHKAIAQKIETLCNRSAQMLERFYFVTPLLATRCGHSFHNKYDPCGEAKSIVNEYYKEKNQESIIEVVGFGLGFHIQELLSTMSKQQALHIFLIDPRLFKLVLQTIDLTTMLNDQRLTFVSSVNVDTALHLPSEPEKNFICDPNEYAQQMTT